MDYDIVSKVKVTKWPHLNSVTYVYKWIQLKWIPQR